MADQGELYANSWILYHVLDRFIGSRELVDIRRRIAVLDENFSNQNEFHAQIFLTGSKPEGMKMQGSDNDFMLTDTDVMVLCQDTGIPDTSNPDTCNPLNYMHKTVLIMRNTDSRPGYVALEVVHAREISDRCLDESIVPVGELHLVSSEIYTRFLHDRFTCFQLHTEMHGPATNINTEGIHLSAGHDVSKTFRCYSWPKDADEWKTRPRLYNWPDQSLRDEIVQGGCYLVPVGDKTSDDTFLQWRISFTTAERKLVYSLTHVQFLVYGLLKYFLKQISDKLKQLVGDTDILSSYIIKTAVFYAVESTPGSFWQEKHTFLCFMFCLNILITWVKTGYCPNYFIKRNNMFLGKVHGENQDKLLCFLVDLHDKKWGCLSVGTFIQPSIGERMNTARNGLLEYVLKSSTLLELECNATIITKTFTYRWSLDVLPVSLALLSESKSDMDEFIGYTTTAGSLSQIGMETFGKHIAVSGNKEKYKSLRRSKKLLTPLASICTSPGELTLATYYYQTGNYSKALDICEHMIVSNKIYLSPYTGKHIDENNAPRLSGHGKTLLQKCKEGCTSDIRFVKNTSQFCPTYLHQEIKNVLDAHLLTIPPIPYAVFLSFLCYHKLGDTSRRDEALMHLRAVKHDVIKWVRIYWIVHNLLGICYEIVGDTQRAIREYRDSLSVRGFGQHMNPAKERIERLQHF
ncbi:uncharacterized protein LOC117319240 [Pecten maximus]|uniref:uncharacterized protein LOC117319240 n=1 Tax=Pecten maximus TaxID=6579 RepID=UPI001457ED88|nr:uncharacterized protein LOC117319240 [Pecten maximus]